MSCQELNEVAQELNEIATDALERVRALADETWEKILAIIRQRPYQNKKGEKYLRRKVESVISSAEDFFGSQKFLENNNVDTAKASANYLLDRYREFCARTISSASHDLSCIGVNLPI